MPGHHDHAALMGGRAKATERYPPRLVATILKALRASMVAAGCKPKDGLVGEVDWTINAVETGPVLEEPEAFTSPPESAEEAEFLDQATGHRPAPGSRTGSGRKIGGMAVHGGVGGHGGSFSR